MVPQLGSMRELAQFHPAAAHRQTAQCLAAQRHSVDLTDGMREKLTWRSTSISTRRRLVAGHTGTHG
jgi:hypothetical protein